MHALGVVPEDQLASLRDAARAGRGEFAAAFMQATMSDRALSGVAAYLLYETLGPTLPDGAASAAALWGLAHRCAMKYPDAVRRAGHADGEALFEAMLNGRSGITLTLDDYEDAWSYVTHPDHRITLEIPELLHELGGLRDADRGHTTADLPLVLSAGERRSSTANTIIRDPAWRKRDGAGALRISPDDAARLGLADGGRARIVTAVGSAETIVEVTDAMHARARVAAERAGRRLPVGRRGWWPGADRRADQRADLAGVARPDCHDAVAQARPGAGRAGVWLIGLRPIGRLRGAAVDRDDGGAAEPDVVLQRDLDAVDLAGARLTAQLPAQLRALGQAGCAERVAL